MVRTSAEGRGPVPVAVTVLRATVVLCTAVFAGLHAPAVSGAVPPWLTALLINVVYVGTTALVVTRAMVVPAHRIVWALIGAGLCCYTAGTAYSWAVTWRGDVLPFPSMSDLAWLMFYPMAYCGVLSFFGGMKLPRRVLLDGAIAGLGGAALFSVLVVDVLLADRNAHGLADVVTLGYPLGNSLLLGTMVCRVAVGATAGQRNPLLVAGIGTFVVADTGYLVISVNGGYQPGGFVNVAYLVGLTLIGLSAWHRGRAGRAARDAQSTATRLGVSTWFALGALVLLMVATRVRLSTVTVTLAGITLVLVVVRVFMALRELESVGRERHSEARRDPLTGLANRRAVQEYVDRLITAPDREPIAMLLLDLDRFKEVNDSYGHQAGDELLRQAAARLDRVTRSSDVLGRLGGDEFVLVMAGTGLTAEAADRLAGRIRTELRRSFELDGVQVTIDVSIGIALEVGDDANALFQHADIAMYNAKRSGGGHDVYRRDDDRRSRDRLELANALRQDVGSDAIMLYYQPKLDLRSGTVRGFEALVRWRHPTRGVLTPDVFLPMAEQNGLMPALTHNVLSQAIRQCAQWRSDGDDVSVAVNASATDLRFEQFPQHIAELLELHGLPASALTVELTETMMLTDSATTERVLGRLTAMGVAVSIDDYGTHHSTLSYLRRLHSVRELKLDRSFIGDLRTDDRSAAIVRSTIDLAHALGLTVVAEGVEDAETLAVLRQWRCDVAQGYHIGRPKPAAEVTGWLSRSTTEGVR